MLTKYHQAQNFTFDLLNNTQEQLISFWSTIHVARTHLVIHNQSPIPQAELNPKFIKAMHDDLNLPNVLS